MRVISTRVITLELFLTVVDLDAICEIVNFLILVLMVYVELHGI